LFTAISVAVGLMDFDSALWHVMQALQQQITAKSIIRNKYEFMIRNLLTLVAGF
jgi:hypothetical protein